MWSKEKREEAISIYLNSNSDLSEVSRCCGVPTSTLTTWISEYWEEEELRIIKEMEKRREERAKAANRRKRRFVNGKELQVIRPTSGSAYIDWRKK